MAARRSRQKQSRAHTVTTLSHTAQAPSEGAILLRTRYVASCPPTECNVAVYVAALYSRNAAWCAWCRFDELEGALKKILSDMVPQKKTDQKKRMAGATNASRAKVGAGTPPLPQGQLGQEAVDDTAINMTAEEDTKDVAAVWLQTKPPPPAAKSLWDRIYCVSSASKVRREYTKEMARDLGKDMLWHFKFFTLFPMIVLTLSRADKRRTHKAAPFLYIACTYCMHVSVLTRS